MSVPSSAIKNPRKLGTGRFPETSVGNYHYTLRNRPDERSSYLMCVFKTDRSICVVFCIQIAYSSYGETVRDLPGFSTAEGSVQPCYCPSGNRRARNKQLQVQESRDIEIPHRPVMCCVRNLLRFKKDMKH
jgi:hypothetical protein